MGFCHCFSFLNPWFTRPLLVIFTVKTCRKGITSFVNKQLISLKFNFRRNITWKGALNVNKQFIVLTQVNIYIECEWDKLFVYIQGFTLMKIDIRTNWSIVCLQIAIASFETHFWQLSFTLELWFLMTVLYTEINSDSRFFFHLESLGMLSCL